MTRHGVTVVLPIDVADGYRFLNNLQGGGLKVMVQSLCPCQGTMIYRASDFRIVNGFATVEDGNQITAFRVADMESFKTVWISSESVWDLVIRMRSGTKIRLSFHALGDVVERLLDRRAPMS